MSMNKFNMNKSIFEYFRWVISTRKEAVADLLFLQNMGT